MIPMPHYTMIFFDLKQDEFIIDDDVKGKKGKKGKKIQFKL